MAIDLSGTVRHFGADYTLRRPGATSYVGGFPVAAAEDEIELTIRAVVTPATEADLQRLPSGDQAAEHVKVLAADEVRTTNVQAATGPDVLEYRGLDWELISVDVYDTHGLFWDALARRVGQ